MNELTKLENELEEKIKHHNEVLQIGLDRLKTLKKRKRITHNNRPDWNINLTNKAIEIKIKERKAELLGIQEAKKIFIEMLDKIDYNEILDSVCYYPTNSDYPQYNNEDIARILKQSLNSEEKT